MVPVECYFVLSALLFFIGVFGFITRRNLIAMLISVELILNAVDINFAAFNRLLFPGSMEGMFMTLFLRRSFRSRVGSGYCNYHQCLSQLQER
jgi:NADH-quinone oxidoreductase subunit K